MIGKGLNTLCNALRFLVGVLMGALIIPVGMQVIARYTGVIPIYLWTEELATFIFVWIVMLGSIVAVWEGTHFDVQVLPESKKPLVALFQKSIVLVLVGTFSVLVAWYGIDYANFGAIQHSVMMRANLLVTFISVPIAGFLWTIFTVYKLYEAISEYLAARKVTT